MHRNQVSPYQLIVEVEYKGTPQYPYKSFVSFRWQKFGRKSHRLHSGLQAELKLQNATQVNEQRKLLLPFTVYFCLLDLGLDLVSVGKLSELFFVKFLQKKMNFNTYYKFCYQEMIWIQCFNIGHRGRCPKLTNGVTEHAKVPLKCTFSKPQSKHKHS